MPVPQTKQICFLGDVRISEHAQAIDDRAGTRGRLPGQVVEDIRAYDVPGLYEDTGNISGFVAQSTKAARLQTFVANADQVVFSHGDGITLGDIYRVSKVHPMGHGRSFPVQQMFDLPFSVVSPRHHVLGFLRFYDVAVTGAVNGTAFQIVGGIAAGTKLVVNVHPWFQSGGASTVVHKIEADSANTFAVTPQDFALTNMTDVLGGGTGGDAQQLEIAATETDDWYRYVVTSVTAGTWKIAVTVALVTT